jgi:Uma2 family endonuclease
MATEVSEEAVVGSASGLTPYLVSSRQFAAMIDAGIFPDGAHVELLGGVLVDKMTKNERHCFCLEKLSDLLRKAVPPDWVVREEKPISLDRLSRPEPDLSVAKGDRSAYYQSFPTPRDLALVVEIADTTYAKDRGVKWRSYAAARIGVYLLVNVALRRVEMFSEPAGDGNTAEYRSQQIFEAPDDFPIIVEGREIMRISVGEILSP